MRTNTFFAKKKSAQAMVEFALALPVLLLLLYGVLEAGRLLFLYSTVVTASRQAVRYGAATGENDAGTPRYNDCDGIRAAANKVAFLSGPGGFDNITIYWDTGPNTTQNVYCAGSIGSLTTANLEGNSTRLVVKVTDLFVPIIPKIVPFIQRNIIAKSARTILYSVPIVMDQDETGFYQERTTTTIMSDTPDSSGPGATVTLTIKVESDIDNDTVTTPTGKIIITGVDDATGCGGTAGIDLVDSGVNGRATVTCTVVFSTSGNRVISATYGGDDTHLPSSDVENHTVQVATTVTTITFIAPNPAVKNQNVSFTVTVTGGSTTPTGTVQVDGGGSNNCQVTLSGGTGTCTMVGGFNSAGTKSITATYSGDSGHLTSTSPTVSLQVLNGTATPSNTPPATLSPTATVQPTTTLSPTATVSPTVTLAPTATATAVPNCNSITVTHGPLTISGTISMSITNNTGSVLLVRDVFLDWYHEKGHKTGGDKTLRLQSATLGGVTFFTGNLYAPSTTITPTGLYVPTGTSSVIFTFHQSADATAADGAEKIIISLASNGCTSVTIDSSH